MDFGLRLYDSHALVLSPESLQYEQNVIHAISQPQVSG